MTEICNLETKLCEQKPLFPLHEMEFWGMIALTYVLCLANTGAVGGAGTQIPVLIGFFKLGTKFAVPRSNLSICIASGMRYVINSGKPPYDLIH